MATGVLLAAYPLRAELTDAQKKALFRKSQSVSSSSPSSSGTHKKKSQGTHSHPGSSKKSAGGSSKKRSASHGKQPPAPSSDAYHSTSVAAVSTPAAPPASPLPLPHGSTPSLPITIEKSGLEAEQGLEPAPTPERAPTGFWSRLFGPGKSYTYLRASTRAAIDRAPVRRGRWKYIIVHNSGTREGNARVFDIYHRRIRHMQNGLAYHFVIGDGHGSRDGQIEIGERWTRQINGGHVASDYLNDIALGICLVGDFNRDLPTRAQVGALEELVSYLRGRVGRSQGRQAIVHAHKEINPRPTDCPGNRFPYGWLHAKFR